MEYDIRTISYARTGASGSMSSSLLANAKAGQSEAWQRLLDLYTPLVYEWCRRSNLPPEDIADVLQEVLSSVAQCLNDFHGAGVHGSFRAWLRQIARSRIADHFRQERLETLAPEWVETVQATQSAPPQSLCPATTRPELKPHSGAAAWSRSVPSLRTARGRRFGGWPSMVNALPTWLKNSECKSLRSDRPNPASSLVFGRS